jgi:hypothetical protein
MGSEYLLVLKAPMHTAANGKTQTIGVDTSVEIKVPIPKSEVLAWGAVDNANLVWKSCSVAYSGKAPVEQRRKSDS